MSERDGESRRTLARRAQRAAGDRSGRLARELMKVPDSTLRKLELDADLRDVVDKARAVTALGARRRSERALAGELRRIDLAKLAAKLATVQATGAAEPELFHLAEQWRTRLIAEGIAGAEKFPGGAEDPLPQLIQKAQSERDTGKPPGAARALFRHVAAVLKAHADAPATDDEDDDDDDEETDDDDET